MIETALRLVLPGAAMLAGLSAATFVGALRSKPETAAHASIAEQFGQLSVSRQEQLLSWADSLQELKKSPAEFQRLQSLHAAVELDSELEEKLARFHEWWGSLEAVEKQRVRREGGSGASWIANVEEAYANSDMRSHQITVRLRPPGVWRGPVTMASFTEANYESFLREAIPSDLPALLKKKFALYDEGCDRNLYQTMWLFSELRKQPFSGGRPNPGAPTSLVSVANLQQAVADHLADRNYAKSPGAASMPYLLAAFEHYSELFRAKHFSSGEDDLVSLYEDLPPEAQLELMKNDAAESRKELKNLLIRKVSAKDPAIAELAEAVAGLKKSFEEWRRIMEKGRPGGKGRGGGSRGGFGGNSRSGENGGPPRGGADRRDDQRRGQNFGAPDNSRQEPSRFRSSPDGARPEPR